MKGALYDGRRPRGAAVALCPGLAAGAQSPGGMAENRSLLASGLSDRIHGPVKNTGGKRLRVPV